MSRRPHALERLDDRWVQHLARGLRSLHRAGLRVRRSGRRSSAALAGLVVLVLAAGIATAVVGPSGGGSASAAHSTGRGHGVMAPVAAFVGPTPGEPVTTYLAEARQRLAALAGGDQSQRRYAVVSFAAAQTPAAAGSLIGGSRPVRAYVQAALPGGPGPVRSLTVQSLVVDLSPALGRLRTALNATARQVRHAAEVARQSNPAVASQAQQLLDQAQTYAAEAAALSDGCGCVIGVLVNGTARSLQQLGTRQGVRVVDVAPAGVPLAGLEVVPLPPSATTTVPTIGPVSGP